MAYRAFKVGDIITGLPENGCLYTTDKVIMQVIGHSTIPGYVSVKKNSGDIEWPCPTLTVVNSDKHFKLAEDTDMKKETTENTATVFDMNFKRMIKRVLYNGPATIVFWRDGTKTVVKCTNEEFDKEKALAMAIVRRMSGNKYDYYDVFKKFC